MPGRDLEHGGPVGHVTRKALKVFHRSARNVVKNRWRRTLPFGEYVSDRWEKARFLGFGEGSSIYDSAVVLGDVTVGCHTWIGPFTVLDGSGGLKIGDFCSISSGVQVYTHDSMKWAVSGGREKIERSPTRIGSCCYIGPNTVIARGVTIGDGCVIGANSLVLENIPAGSRAWGTPCKITGRSEKRDIPSQADAR